MRKFLPALLLPLLVAPLARADVATIDTTPAYVGGTVSSFGTPNSATYGQTFQTPDALHTVLDDFTIYANPGGNLYAEAYVYAWTGTGIAGPALFATSSPTLLSGDNTAFNAYTFNTNSVSLTSGQQYVFFLSLSPDFNNSSGFSIWKSVAPATYPNGTFVFQNNGPDFSTLSTASWVTTVNIDLAFTANFSTPATPLPAAAFAPLALLPLLALRRRTRFA